VVAPAIFGITNDGLNLAVKLLLLFLAAIYFALVWWTYADARRRVADPMLVVCATAAAGFFPFVGSIVYAIVRPPEYLEDARERELEIAAAEARLLHLQESTCPHCGHDIEKAFLRCPHCTRRLKEPCHDCARPLDPRWQICPYCEAEVAPPATAAAPEPQRRRGRRTPAAGRAERSAPARQTAAARDERRAEPGIESTTDAPRGGRSPRAEGPQPGRAARADAAPASRETRADAPPAGRARADAPSSSRAQAEPPSSRRSSRADGAASARADGAASSRAEAAFRPVRDAEREARPARVLRDPPPPPDPSSRVTDATAEQPARRSRPQTDPF
jgi:hypothetical protein